MPPPCASPPGPIAVPVLLPTVVFRRVSRPPFATPPPWAIADPVVVVVVALLPLTRLSLIRISLSLAMLTPPPNAIAVPAGAIAVRRLSVKRLPLIVTVVGGSSQQPVLPLITSDPSTQMPPQAPTASPLRLVAEAVLPLMVEFRTVANTLP